MRFKLLIAMLFCFSISAHAEIRQEYGVDQRVDYQSLTELGPWDDRNYQLTQEDLAILPENDHFVRNVPAFFKVKARQANPHIGEFYPRELYHAFLIHFGGLIVDGVWYKEGIGKYYHPVTLSGKPDDPREGATVDPDGEVILRIDGNEGTVEFNPDNNMQVVAGANANGGQEMYYSSDGGATWTASQVNPNSCCDPTIDWSTTDVSPQRVYQADLANCGFGGCNIRASYSEDAGQTWATMIEIETDQANDKEFIHVDRSPTSPHKDNIYITYHKGNQMRFARSTDFGTTWSTPIDVGVDTGIGSDITTDSSGNVYYFYPGLNGSGINMLKSTDGGLTFEPVVQVSTIRGRFDFPIPAMETREVFIYTSVDVDSADNIYVAITDETADSVGGGTGSASANHAEIRVFKSTDAGATWTELPKPHQTNDQLTVDRFHPWLMVGENDAVHIGFYDTRNSVNRTGVDFYYNVSTDGGASWLPEGEQRYSTVTSDNLSSGQEWGDYNGLSVVLDKIAMTWTDGRPGASSNGDAFLGYGGNAFGSPTFNIAANPNGITVCAGDNALVGLNITDVQNYPGTITLSEFSTPTYVNGGAFSANGSAAPFSSDYTFNVDGSGTTGIETLTIRATGDDMGDIITKDVDVTVTYSAGAAGASTLTAPVDSATNVPAQPSFTWTADPNATSYLIEVATDPAFTNVVISETVLTNSYDATTSLATSTDHYWRVESTSPCGSAMSSEFSFTTTVAPGDCPIGTNQVDLMTFTFDTPDDLIWKYGNDGGQGLTAGDADPQGWTVQTAAGQANWSLQNVGDSGTAGWQADDLPEVNDTSVVSPQMSLPNGVGPLTLRFWNTQTIEDGGAGCYDAGQLFVSADNGPFTQVTDADIINNDYDGTIDSGFSNPAAGEQGWCGDPLAATQFNVDVDTYAGQDVQFSYRMASDSSVGRPEGWVIDNVRITGCEAP